MKLQLGIVFLVSLPFWHGVLGRSLNGQVPVVNGGLGGVPDPSEATTHPEVSKFAARTPGKLRVIENSGVCETTPGVYQASGYADLNETQSIWFWLFAARKNPETAPLALWFNGGPGASSMMGLVQEHGPCRIKNDSSSVTHNPYSWNNEATVMYIDQPAGTGFSHGAVEVGTSQQAAVVIWTFMQVFLSDPRFSKYCNTRLALWTESYGGRYGPVFAAYFLAQNAAILEGTISGIRLNLQVLAMGNGLTNALVQYPEYITYAASNPYHPLVSQEVIDQATSDWSRPNGCKDQIIACNNEGSDSVCSAAQYFCDNNILLPLAGNYDVYYVLAQNPDPYPPSIDTYMNTIAAQIGAEKPWVKVNYTVYQNFENTGDKMRSSQRDLETVINSGVRTLIYNGDADYIVNFKGAEAMVDTLNTKFTEIFKAQSFQTYRVNGGLIGQFKNAGKFSYIRMYGVGHQVPAYKYGNLSIGQAAAQIFTQIMRDQSLSST